MNDAFVILQSERSLFRARGPASRVKKRPNPQTFRDPDEHRGIFDIDDPPGWRLSRCPALRTRKVHIRKPDANIG